MPRGRAARIAKLAGIFFMAVLILSAVLGFLYPMVSRGEKAPASTPEIEEKLNAHKPFIIYFRYEKSPACSEQDRELLRAIYPDYAWKVDLVVIEYSNDTVKVFKDYGIQGVPSLVFVDREGYIKYIFKTQLVKADTIKKVLAQLVS